MIVRIINGMNTNKRYGIIFSLYRKRMLFGIPSIIFKFAANLGNLNLEELNLKLTSSIVFDPWCNLDAAGGKRDTHAGFFVKNTENKPKCW